MAEQTKANNEEIKTSNRKSHSRWWTRKSRILRWMASSTACRRKRDTQDFRRKADGKGLVFFDVLREQGFGHLITERVDPRTLDSAMNNLAAENDGELPEEMAEVLSVYSELKVSKRKANTKALNRAKKAQEV